MGDYFTLAHYYGQYQEAVIACDRASERLKLAKETAIYSADPEAAQEHIAELEAEYQAAKAKMDDLWYKANTGKSKEELGFDPKQKRLPIHGVFTHYPENKPWTLPR